MVAFAESQRLNRPYGEWTYYVYAADNSLTKHFPDDEERATYYHYDDSGSCSRIDSIFGSTYFEYNAANLPKKVIVDGGSEFEFGYDGNLQRRAIVEDGTATYYVWDGLRLLETRNADHSLKARFTHGYTNIEGIGSCIEVYRASDSKRFYLLYDHRGSAWVLLDESKAEVGRRLYNAFGELVQETLATGYSEWPDEVPFGYQSNWLTLLNLPDGTPLYLSPTRAYVASLGIFLQRDPRFGLGEITRDSLDLSRLPEIGERKTARRYSSDRLRTSYVLLRRLQRILHFARLAETYAFQGCNPLIAVDPTGEVVGLVIGVGALIAGIVGGTIVAAKVSVAAGVAICVVGGVASIVAIAWDWSSREDHLKRLMKALDEVAEQARKGVYAMGTCMALERHSKKLRGLFEVARMLVKNCVQEDPDRSCREEWEQFFRARDMYNEHQAKTRELAMNPEEEIPESIDALNWNPPGHTQAEGIEEAFKAIE